MSYQDYLAGEPLILTVPTTGGVQGKEANPNLPESPEEIANAARECEKLGASIVHLHGRDEHGERDAGRLQEINELVRERCEDIIIQNTTGGTGLPLEERVKGIRTDPLPEMASLDMGPMNRYQHITAENTRHMIDTLAAEMQEKGIKPEMEVFNNGHLNEVYRLIEKGLLEEPYYINIIFGPGTLTPPTPENMVNMINNLPENSIFNVLAIGRHQLPLTTMGIVMGGHIRVGMEDNLYFRKGEPVESNAQLVERAVRIADELERDLATPADARELLGM
ncbi:3-keto-5-aminohexanoate cleavage enzyme [Natronorubrum sediminis]|uniref:3-keto-5-aminohexanoate cleavage enzyme n=1 Tax=Natronorubrum sediminis TaxID=640943 RepID=A0A1H6FT83_9EURY|nr:3-keto-5-aminohexanoate cleavage protein [Natronorubrum sediminis]SEH13602.1 3-keto-5-aminohexanoate cleavage enzyme [Natronorubrum sediminis]